MYLWLISLDEHLLYSSLWRNMENYPYIITKYPPYSHSQVSENIINFLLCIVIYLSHVNLTIQLSQFDEYPRKKYTCTGILRLFIGHSQFDN